MSKDLNEMPTKTFKINSPLHFTIQVECCEDSRISYERCSNLEENVTNVRQLTLQGNGIGTATGN